MASVLQKGRAPEWVHRHVGGARVWLTFVSVGELWKWAEVRSWGEPKRSRLDAWISARPVIPYDVSVARWWARLAAGAQLRGRPRPQNDSWIAACCLNVNHALPLLTLNRVDLVDFAEHHGLVSLGEDG